MESFAKKRSSCQGVLKPPYLWRQFTLLLLDMRDQWVTEVRPANESENEAGADYTQCVTAKYHLASSGTPVLGMGGGFLKDGCCAEGH